MTSWASSGRGGLAGADGPDRLVGEDDLLRLLGREPGQRGVELRAACATCSPASRTPGPPRRTGSARGSLASAAFTFALTSASSSWWYARRSECPTTHVRAAELGQHRRRRSRRCTRRTSCAERSCAPYPISSLSPSISVCTLRMSVNGGSTTTSTSVELLLGQAERELLHQRDGLEVVEVHLPVAGHQRPARCGRAMSVSSPGAATGRAASCLPGTPATRRRRSRCG